MRLKKSKVVFDEAQHTYHLNGVAKSGITPLISSVLMLGNYSDLSPFAKQVMLPTAARYGTAVHKSIQTYEETGIKSTIYGEEEFETEDYGTQFMPDIDVSAELESYIENKPADCDVAASEFLVDFGQFASSIDAVWKVGKQIWLVDFKTTNLDSYKGGEYAMKEYLSWQLSCYAFMFERQTGKKVDKLVGLWLRGDKSKLWVIDRKDDEDIRCLLEDTEVMELGGHFIYNNEKMQRVEQFSLTATSKDLFVPIEITSAIYNLLMAEKAAKLMKERLRELMEENSIKKWECDQFTATLAKDSVTTKFDTKSFKDKHPDLYEEFLTSSTRKGGLIIKAK